MDIFFDWIYIYSYNLYRLPIFLTYGLSSNFRFYLIFLVVFRFDFILPSSLSFLQALPNSQSDRYHFPKWSRDTSRLFNRRLHFCLFFWSSVAQFIAATFTQMSSSEYFSNLQSLKSSSYGLFKIKVMLYYESLRLFDFSELYVRKKLYKKNSSKSIKVLESSILHDLIM